MEKLFYTISEVAEELGESITCVRYWTNEYPELVKPTRNAKGNRQYKKQDIEALAKIQHLSKNEGLTLNGAARQIRIDSSKVDKKLKALESLKAIRAQLLEIKESM